MTTKGDSTALDVLVCPECGNNGRGGVLRYAIDLVATADVLAVQRGVLHLAGPPRRLAGDAPIRPRIECNGLRDDGRVCGHTFALPTTVSALTWKVT